MKFRTLFFSLVIPTVYARFFPHLLNWRYSITQEPEQWEGLCATGTRQSPINIDTATLEMADLRDLKFNNYNHAGPINVTNNGVTLIVSGFHTWGKRNWPYISGGGLQHNYQLVQFHIHWSQDDNDGSEHTINGKYTVAEIHLLHLKQGRTLDEALLEPDGVMVLGLMVTVGSNGKALETFDTAFRSLLLPFTRGQNLPIPRYKPMSILSSAKDSFYRYNGSLTTPKCEEAVIWTILAEPISITSSQLHMLRSIRLISGNKVEDNVRPIQALNGRKVLYRHKNKNLPCDSNSISSEFRQPWC